ncbi:hypothetical protein ACFW04_012605 [Cataglyphis niger]
MEIKNNNKLDFLDPTFSGRYLNFLSQHSVCQKKGTIMGLIDRAFRLSHPQYPREEPRGLFDPKLAIVSRGKFRVLRFPLAAEIRWDVTQSKRKIFHDSIRIIHFERFKSITKDLDVRFSYFSLNKLHHFIKVHKDQVPKASSSNIIYKINCDNCDASYVGQTGRQLQTRIKEHRNHIRRNTSSHSVITDHRLQHNHEFKWNDVKILDTEPIYNKRLISKILFIKRQNNSLNLQTDTECFHEAYVNTINKLPKV